MKVSDILQFIFSEMQKAIEEKHKDRVLELGTSVDVLFELAKNNDKKIEDILLKLNYVVFHYEDEFSFTKEYMKKIQEMISKL
jgi:hypothetical protein